MPRLQAVYFWVTVKCDKLTKREERKAKPGYLVKMAESNFQQEKPICPNRNAKISSSKTKKK